MKTTLITGVSGQDGSYLARLLLSKGISVYGSSGDTHSSTSANLAKLGLESRIHHLSINLNDFGSVLQRLIILPQMKCITLEGKAW